MQLNSCFSIECSNQETLEKVFNLVNTFFAMPENRTPEFFDDWVKSIRVNEKYNIVENITDVHADPLEYEDLLASMIEYVSAGISDDVIAGHYDTDNGVSGMKEHLFVGIYGNFQWVSSRKKLFAIEYEDRQLPLAPHLKDKIVVFSQLYNLALEFKYTVIVRRSGGLVRDYTTAKTNVVVYMGQWATPDTKKAEELNQKKEKVKVFTCEEFEAFLKQ